MRGGGVVERDEERIGVPARRREEEEEEEGEEVEKVVPNTYPPQKKKKKKEKHTQRKTRPRTGPGFHLRVRFPIGDVERILEECHTEKVGSGGGSLKNGPPGAV